MFSVMAIPLFPPSPFRLYVATEGRGKMELKGPFFVPVGYWGDEERKELDGGGV